MRKKSFKTNKRWVALLAATALVFGLAGFAAAHPEIPLRDVDGAVITPPANEGDLQPAYSAKATCGFCHDYDQVEQHSYHTQLAANQFFGWNIWNPDSPNAYKNGAAPKGKNWVQSPGHFGKW